MDTDVIVVGAGPTGLLLAGDLAEAGVRVTVLERRTGEANTTRAFAVHARTMEQLRIRGVADELAAGGSTVRGVRVFGSMQIDLSSLPTRYNHLLVTPQYRMEGVLGRRAERLGVRVVRGAEVTGLAQDGFGVSLTARIRTDGDANHPNDANGADGTATTYRARYVVGADGVHSAVRRALGLPFPGRSAVKSIMLADVRLRETPADVLTVNAVGDAFAFIAPFGDGWYRVFAWNRRNQVDDSAPVELAEVAEVTRRSLGTDYGMHDARWLSRFHSDERQVPDYRVGRVFLAGDAAHCHSPAGGQGMNTGLQDAANLGWKLAAAVTGRGAHLPIEELLDSYHAERYPVGRQVLRSSGALLRLALTRTAPARALRGVAVGTLLRIPAVARAVAGSISGIGIRYAAPSGADPRVGTRAPDVTLRDGDLSDALHGGRYALVGDRAADVTLPEGVIAAVPASPSSDADRLVLVRPDGYMGWVGTLDRFAEVRDRFAAAHPVS
ncbi:MAG TPA: FAD-dependent monooxygenase [Pseudonocardia sp.]|jgi:2-polyprenyl-6-methoxyphenol hydroxylase-like FAD-dependent oxidoreductase